MPVDQGDLQLARLFAERQGLTNDAQSALVARLCREVQSSSSSPSTAAAPSAPIAAEARRVPEMLQAPSAPLGMPSTPSWVRTAARSVAEQRRRLSQTLDEAVSVASELTDDVTTIDEGMHTSADEGVESGLSEGSESGRHTNADDLLQISRTGQRLTLDEKCTLEKYETVFLHLHEDIDLLVLRCPRVGEAAASLLRALVEGLLVARQTPAYDKRDVEDGAVVECENSVLDALTRCIGEVSTATGCSVGKAKVPASLASVKVSNFFDSASSARARSTKEELDASREQHCQESLQRKIEDLIDDGVTRHLQELEHCLIGDLSLRGPSA